MNATKHQRPLSTLAAPAIVSMTVWSLILALFFLTTSCTKRPQSLKEAFATVRFPAFGADDFTRVPGKLGRKDAPGGVLSNCCVIQSMDRVRVEFPKIVIVPEEILVQEMLENECSRQSYSPGRPNIPIFFPTKEKFRVLTFDSNGVVLNQEYIRLQNIKLIIKPVQAKQINLLPPPN
jgi:hypothetical protein